MSERHETPPEPPPKPGEALLAALRERQISQSQLARRLGRPKKAISDIVKGYTQITADTAVQLEQVLPESAEYWLGLEARYQRSLAANRLEERAAKGLDWLDELPVEEMLAAQWLKRARTEAKQVTQLLRWFGVASPQAWREVHVEPQAGYHRSPPFDADPGALAAWMRTGEIQARSMKTKPWNRKTFQRALEQIRGLTLEAPAVWQDRMIELAAGAGVAVAFSREVGGLTVVGATRWLSPRLALIHLSLACETDDQLWFTFFHQAGHLLLHGKKQVYLEGAAPVWADRGGDAEEIAADEFASSFLIPDAVLEELRPFCEGRKISQMIVRTFAADLGIAPSIVVARLQQLGWLKVSVFNDLKRPLNWAPPGETSEASVYKTWW